MRRTVKLSGIGNEAILASLFGVPKVPAKTEWDMDQFALKVQVPNSEREHFPYSHSRRSQDKTDRPEGFISGQRRFEPSHSPNRLSAVLSFSEAQDSNLQPPHPIGIVSSMPDTLAHVRARES